MIGNPLNSGSLNRSLLEEATAYPNNSGTNSSVTFSTLTKNISDYNAWFLSIYSIQEHTYNVQAYTNKFIYSVSFIKEENKFAVMTLSSQTYYSDTESYMCYNSDGYVFEDFFSVQGKTISAKYAESVGGYPTFFAYLRRKSGYKAYQPRYIIYCL